MSTKQCPVCENNLPDPLPPFCEQCAWDLENDLTLVPTMHKIPEEVQRIYVQRLAIAKRVWSEKIEAIRKQRELEKDELKREQEEKNKLEKERKQLQEEKNKLEKERKQLEQVFKDSQNEAKTIKNEVLKLKQQIDESSKQKENAKGDYDRTIENRAKAIAKVINTVFNYKTLPFLPVVLFVLYPFFFNANLDILTLLFGVWNMDTDIDILPLLLIIAISTKWWIYCADGFTMKSIIDPLEIFEEHRKDGLFKAIYMWAFFTLNTYVILAIIFFIAAVLVAGISNLINFYITVLPMALWLSYKTMLVLEENY